MTLPDFSPMPKMSRFTRDCIITEKIDGTNASLYIPDAGEDLVTNSGRSVPFLAGSRTRWIFPEDDNAGFARWAFDHAEEVLALGPGHHFGEWWGSKIGRTYGLPPGEKRFSLFNTLRWRDSIGTNHAWEPLLRERFKSEPALLPESMRVVPILSVCEFGTMIPQVMEGLRENGSVAQRGFLNPEGIVIFHVQGGFLMKKTFEGDEKGKSYGG